MLQFHHRPEANLEAPLSPGRSCCLFVPGLQFWSYKLVRGYLRYKKNEQATKSGSSRACEAHAAKVA